MLTLYEYQYIILDNKQHVVLKMKNVKRRKHMFEMVNNRRVIFGERKIEEIPGILQWYGKKKVFFAVYSKESDGYKRIADLFEKSCLLRCISRRTRSSCNQSWPGLIPERML